MQKTFFDLEYNPKIDFLITKNLLTSWPRKFNEFDLRRAFKKKFGGAPKELKPIKQIRDFLRKHRLENFKKKDFEELIGMITKQKFKYDFIIPFEEMTAEYLDKYVSFLKLIVSREIAHACLATMVLYVCAKNQEIIVPYRGAIKRVLFDERPISGDLLISALKERVKHVNTKHDISENVLVRNMVKEKKDEFLRTFRNVKGYGIYGSFAMGKENEYSDLDMLVISDEGKNYNLEYEISAFWHRYFSIDIDVKIVKEDDIDQELTECMKKTLKMVA